MWMNWMSSVLKKKQILTHLFKNYFNFQMPTGMLKTLRNLNDSQKNNQLVNMIKSGLSDLRNEMKKMCEEVIKTEKQYEIVDIVEEILEFNK